jgi:hypothetical protein
MHFGLLILALQVGFGVHAVKTGRTSPWLWIIVFVPLVGCLIYLFAVVLAGGGATSPLDQEIMFTGD